MNIQDKIEEIRKKPEHIRLRYAWGLTFFSLVIILVIWAISISAQKSAPQDESASQNQQQLMQDLKGQKKSLENTTGQMKDFINNVSTQEKNNTNNTNANVQNEGFSGN